MTVCRRKSSMSRTRVIIGIVLRPLDKKSISQYIIARIDDYLKCYETPFERMGFLF